MTLQQEVRKANTKKQVVFVAMLIGTDKEKFAKLMQMFFSEDLATAQQAAWVMSHCVELYPELATPYIGKMIKNLFNKVSDATKRNTVRVLQWLEIPEELWGETIEICFRFLSGPEAVAIKAFAMTVLYNLSLKVPEIAHELKIVIEDQYPYGSAGFKSRANKILAKLNS